MKGGYDRKGLFGDIIHYDENGKKIGVSKKGLFGNYKEYDADGNKIGHSDPTLIAGWDDRRERMERAARMGYKSSVDWFNERKKK